MPASQVYNNPSQTVTAVTSKRLANSARQQKPWYVRTSITQNGISIPHNTAIAIGFDTLDINSYQALGDPKYSLKFTGATIGGHSYPYTIVTVPTYGIYDVGIISWLDCSAAGTALEADVRIVRNNHIQQQANIQTPGNQGSGTVSVSVRDVFTCDPGDQINAGLFIEDQTNSALTILGGVSSFGTGNLTVMIIRYMGTG